MAAALAAEPQGLGVAAVKDRNNVIDKQIDEDSRKFKRECKILLLGELSEWTELTERLWRVGEEHDRQADEDYSSERVLEGGAAQLPDDSVGPPGRPSSTLTDV